MAEAERRDRRLALFLAAVLLLNFPVLAVVDRITLGSGAPLTPYYLFAAWGVVIALAALVARRRQG